MTLPKYHEIMPFALAYFAEHGAQKWRNSEASPSNGCT